MKYTPRILTIGDIHLSDHAPGARRDNYRAAVMGKLRKLILEAALKLRVALILLTGDIFHLKSASRNSHGLVRELIEILRAAPCPVFAAPGNHDMKNDSPASIPSQPLGVVFESGALRELTPNGFLFHVVGGQTLTTSGELDSQVWMEEGRGKRFSGERFVKVCATAYNEVDPLSECRKITRTHEDLPGKEVDHLVTVGHFYATPEGGPFFKHTCASYGELAQTPTDIFVLGHFHIDQGIQRVGEKVFINLGSLTRGSLDEDNIHRKVKVGLIDLSDPQPKFKELIVPVEPAEVVFDLQKYEEIKEERKEMEDFVDHLEVEFSRVVGSEEGGGPMELLAKMTIPQEVREDVQRRIQEAEAE